VQVPLRLARRDSPPAADAFLLLAEGFGPLADACAKFGDVLPHVYSVHGGFLLVARASPARPPVGTIRLRRLTGDAFILADSALLPSLLTDEVTALTRDRGLVVLPGGQVFAFDPTRPLPIGDWLAVARVRRSEWQPFPPRPERPDRLTTIERPARTVVVIELLSAGQPEGAAPLPGAGEGSPDGAGRIPEGARPPGGSMLGRIGAGVKLGFGQLLAWLGRALAAPGLAKKGADMARQALEQVPRLSEKVLGAQEAALREVLRQLRSGDIEKALRHAPIAVPDPNVPSRVGTDARLGTRDPRYSLRDLITSGGGGGVGWLGGADVWAELAREYRRLAQEAAARGDYRRAAYLHGVLLRDLRSAANALMAGGLFRDAALLFRDKLNDDRSAAHAFEQAGDYDEAIRLLEKHNEYERAGDLLRRLGDGARAADFYTRAAEVFAAKGQWVAAGDLLRRNVGDRKRAAEFYRAGWTAGAAESVACGERLLDEHFVAGEWAEVRTLFDEAARGLTPPRSRDAGRFFNYVLKVGDPFLPPDLRDELTDRVRLLFAAHLRANTGGSGWAGELVSELFGRETHWPGPVVRDAAFSSRATVRRPATPTPLTHEPVVPLAEGRVTAVAVARDTGDIVVATSSALVFWEVDEGRVLPVCSIVWRDVFALSVASAGGLVYVLYADDDNDDDSSLGCFASPSRRGSFRAQGQVFIAVPDVNARDCYLQPEPSSHRGEPIITLSTPDKRLTFRGVNLQPERTTSFRPSSGGTTHLLVEHDESCSWEWEGRDLRCRYVDGPTSTGCTCQVPWVPGRPEGGTLDGTRVDWITPIQRVLEVAGVDADGALYWSEFDARGSGSTRSKTVTETHHDRFLAACLLGPGAVAAVTGQNEVHWLRVTGGPRFRAWAPPRKLAVPARAVAIVSRPHANEVVAVLDDGSAVRVPKP
jgi:hypothetical protein